MFSPHSQAAFKSTTFHSDSYTNQKLASKKREALTQQTSGKRQKQNGGHCISITK
jgi:hypothetical protein